MMMKLKLIVALFVFICVCACVSVSVVAAAEQSDEDRERERERYRRGDDTPLSPEEEHAYALHQLAEEAKEFEVTYYALLGVPDGASMSVIKKRYYQLAKELHPDVNPSEAAADTFRGIAKAYKTLSDGDSRKLYDELLRDGLPYELSDVDFRYPGEIYSKYYNAPTHNSRNVIVALVLLFSGCHYVYMWYAYQSELARAKKSPLYRARLKEKDGKKKPSKSKSKSGTGKRGGPVRTTGGASPDVVTGSVSGTRKRGGLKGKASQGQGQGNVSGTESPALSASDVDDERDRDAPPDIEFVNLKQPRVLDIFTIWLVLLPVRAIWRLIQKIRGIEDPVDDLANSRVPAVRLSRYGYKEDYVIEED